MSSLVVSIGVLYVLGVDITRGEGNCCMHIYSNVVLCMGCILSIYLYLTTFTRYIRLQYRLIHFYRNYPLLLICLVITDIDSFSGLDIDINICECLCGLFSRSGSDRENSRFLTASSDESRKLV